MVLSAFISTHTNPLITCAVGCLSSTVVIWSTKKTVRKAREDINEIRKELKADMKELKVDIKELKADIKELEWKLAVDLRHVAISSHSPYSPLAVMNCPTGCRRVMNKWGEDTGNCDMSGDQHGAPAMSALQIKKV